ncbi:uncharacterized protein LOC123318376 [Coccinella septempunctata]|uniref:uncharacterized protein LOC123318376 n=1 Tax=Coccinella septempunctata TaxID=41139 RepID=UPI001D05DBEA|nr:uncharacterized protein LOC123318376 [Coccinella septempunctata]
MEAGRGKRSHTHEWGLLFPLKSGLFAMRSSNSHSTDRLKCKSNSKKVAENERIRMRRGSSLSELDKLADNALPDLVRSTTAQHQLSLSPASLPHSPYLSRSLMSSNTTSIRGSIGDLMNQKKFGSSQWSVRSETLIAKTVPLSTVTPRHSPPAVSCDITLERTLQEFDTLGPLTAAQRTQKLSRLIKQQRSAIYRGVGEF